MTCARNVYAGEFRQPYHLNISSVASASWTKSRQKAITVRFGFSVSDETNDRQFLFALCGHGFEVGFYRRPILSTGRNVRDFTRFFLLM